MIRPALASGARTRIDEPWRQITWVNPLESRYERMPQFGPLHYFMLVLSIITSGIFIMAAKHYDRLGAFAKARVVTGWVLGVLGGLWMLLSLDFKQRDVRETLPLHLCDILRPIMAFSLVTGHPLALQLSIYWGIVLNPQAIITPDLPYYYEPKWLRYTTYWFFHIVALAIPLALLAGGEKLSWKGFRFTAAMTACWAAASMVVNKILDSNYGFVSAHPNGHSFLSVLPWPYNLAVGGLGIAGAWAAMTHFFKNSPDCFLNSPDCV